MVIKQLIWKLNFLYLRATTKLNKMKTTVFALIFCAFGFTGNAQTAKDLIGKWQLVHWTSTNGKDKDIKDYFKTDQVFQVFYEDGHFESLNGNESHKGKWKLSPDNKELTITSTIIPVKFHVESFSDGKRITSYESLGTFEHKKVAD